MRDFEEIERDMRELMDSNLPGSVVMPRAEALLAEMNAYIEHEFMVAGALRREQLERFPEQALDAALEDIGLAAEVAFARRGPKDDCGQATEEDGR
jgi:hypothetical protein